MRRPATRPRPPLLMVAAQRPAPPRASWVPVNNKVKTRRQLQTHNYPQVINVVSFRKQILNGNIVNCKTYAVLVGVLLRSHSKSKETSVILWLYDFFWQFEQYIHHYYSIISKCNKTYSRTTAIIFQRVVKRETSTTYTYYGITMLLKIDLSFKKVWLTFLSLWTRLK